MKTVTSYRTPNTEPGDAGGPDVISALQCDSLTVNKQLIDLSHTIEHGLITYRGLAAPLICDFLGREQSKEHYAPGTEFQIGKIEMVANTGTYLDSPFHRYSDGKDLSELDLQKLANLPAIKIPAQHKQA